MIVCPFCGSKRAQVWETWHPHYTVECDRCEASGPCAGTEADAIAWWNNVGKVSAARVKQLRARLARAEKAAAKERYNSPEAQQQRAEAKQAKADEEWVRKRKTWLRSPIEPENDHG